MTVLVDTGVLYADHDTDAARHGTARNILELVYDGECGQPYVSDYIYDEAVTLTLKRGSFDAASRLGERIRGIDPYPKCTTSFASLGPSSRMQSRYSNDTMTST